MSGAVLYHGEPNGPSLSVLAALEESGPDIETRPIDLLMGERHRIAGIAEPVAMAMAVEGEGPVLVSGQAVGDRIAAGAVRVVRSQQDLEAFQPGEVLVAAATSPDWEAVMKRASAIVTDRGGRTCHAAILAREMGVPAVVGAGDATMRLQTGQSVTVSCVALTRSRSK